MNSLKLVLVFLAFSPISLFAQNDTLKSGKVLFNNKCAACHKFDKKFVGPPLGGVSQKYNTVWLHSWFKDSNALIKSGDSLAISIYEEYNKIPCLTYLNDRDSEKVLDFMDNFPIKKAVFRPLDENKIKGKKLFNANCAACHKLDKRLIGPPLKGIEKKHEREWLHAFIKDSQALIDSGDTLAIKVYEEYNRMPMMSYPQLSEEDISALLVYFNENIVEEN